MRADLRIKRVLLPIDGSGTAFHAAKYAVRIAKHEGASLICIHAIRKPIYWYEPRYTDWEDEYYDKAKKAAERWFKKVRKMSSKEGIDMKTDIILDVESVVDAIVKYAEERNISLIVVGSRGMTGLKKFLMGSIAKGITLHSHCPVLVVR
ncbi:MAG: universal stress protein [Nitrososphaerales archaeon]